MELDAWPIFVISLQDQTRRRQQIASQLTSLGLDFTFLNAIDGRHGLPSELEGKVDRPGTLRALGRVMTDAEYACALSHMLVAELTLASRAEGAIVLEDDAVLEIDFKEFLMAGGHRSAGLVQFDYMHALVWKSGHKSILPGVSTRRLVHKAPLATGYAISRPACEYLIRNGLPIRQTADWPVETARIGAVITVPRLVRSFDIDFADSSLHAARVDSERLRARSEGWIISSLRRLRSLCAVPFTDRFN